MKVEPYSAISPELLRKAEMVKSNTKFAQDVCNILKKNAEEKNANIITRRHRT